VITEGEVEVMEVPPSSFLRGEVHGTSCLEVVLVLVLLFIMKRLFVSVGGGGVVYTGCCGHPCIPEEELSGTGLFNTKYPEAERPKLCIVVGVNGDCRDIVLAEGGEGPVGRVIAGVTRQGILQSCHTHKQVLVYLL